MIKKSQATDKGKIVLLRGLSNTKQVKNIVASTPQE